LDTIQATTSAYNHTIFAYQQEDLAQAVVAETEKLRDQIYLRQNYGFTTDLDTNLTDVLVGHAQLMLADATNQRLNSMLALQELLGINPENSQPIIFTDNLDDIFNVPDQETMLNYALEHNPRIAIARLKILQYEHLMKLEKARTIQTLDFGVGFERPAAHNERTTVGPALTLGLPIFDYNQAQKARAQFLYDQAKKQLKAEKIHTTQIIKSLYNTIQTLAKQIFIYQEKMLPSGHKALGYTIDFNEKMQIAMPIIFQTYLALLDVRKNYIKAQQEYMNAYAQLEQMVSKKLSDF
ncbi:MAG: TolC family protein, partial [Candidatus Babeliales bacterium]